MVETVYACPQCGYMERFRGGGYAYVVPKCRYCDIPLREI